MTTIGQGRAVGPDFRFPWNTTRSLADVRKSANQMKAERAAHNEAERKAASRITHDGKIAYAGRD